MAPGFKALAPMPIVSLPVRVNGFQEHDLLFLSDFEGSEQEDCMLSISSCPLHVTLDRSGRPTQHLRKRLLKHRLSIACACVSAPGDKAIGSDQHRTL